ncbi:MAG: sulfatase-like hydrolase/transferase [Nitrospirae bacterium]|nr:sulfatase-like hydrolase/transferase [Nitrospirota bacterium]
MEKVIVIVCDTLRAKSLPHYGNIRDTTPRLNSVLEQDFTVYKRAYAPSPWTPPSHISLFTGLYPSQAMEHPDSFRLSPVFKSLPELFKDSGYKTFAASANALISRPNGFDRGFDTFLQLWLPNPEKDDTLLVIEGNNRYEKLNGLLRRLLSKDTRRDVSKGIREFIYKRFRNILDDATPSTDRAMKMTKRYLLENRDQKVFCFLNLMQTHNKYNPPAITRNLFAKNNRRLNKFYDNTPQVDHFAVRPFSSELINYLELRYEEEVLYLDIVIEGFIDFLKKNKLYEDATIIITSDHGEHFGENGYIAHGFSVFEPVIKIPLFIKWGGDSRGKDPNSGRLVMLHDLYSTFINRLDHWQPSPLSSFDLNSSEIRHWISASLPDLSYAVNACKEKRASFSLDELGLSGNSLTAYVFEDQIKIIENGNNYLCFDLKTDPCEKNPFLITIEQRKLLEKIIKALA